MKRQLKETEDIEEELYDEEIPEKDKNGIDEIIPKKSILESSDKNLTTNSNDLGRRS